MLSVIIATHDSEHALVATLAALVAGAAAGTVREVIVADGGSRDHTLEVADIAGCRVLESTGQLGARLNAAAAAARAPWLMFLQPGATLDTTWIAEADRFMEESDRSGAADTRAAVFRLASAAGTRRSPILEALALLRTALGGRPRPEQGLIIAQQFYRQLGGHAAVGDPEKELLGRIGTRGIVLLRSGAVMIEAGN